MTRKRPKKIRRGYGGAQGLFMAASFIASTSLLVFLMQPKTEAVASSNQQIKIIQDQDIVILPTPIRAVQIGEKLSSIPTMLTKWPKSNLNQEHVNNIIEYGEYYLSHNIPANIPIPISALQKESSESYSSHDIPTGMRAITLNLDSESALNGFIKTGSFVDVVLIKKSESNSTLESKVIAENIKVISLEKSEGAGQRRSQSHICTLLVSQEDALRIKTASNIGQITFMLRGSNDQSPLETDNIRQNDILGDDEIKQAKQHKGIFKNANGQVYYLTNDGLWLKKIDKKSLRDEQIDRVIKGSR